TRRSDTTLLDFIASGALQHDAWDAAVLTLEKLVSEASDLEPTVVCEIERQIGLWHRDRRSDLDAAEASMHRAVAAQPERLDTLRLLASLQRRSPGLPLVETLLRITHADLEDLGALHEAAEVLCGIETERARARTLLRELLQRSTDGWSGEQGERASHASWAIDKLVDLALEDGAAADAVEL
ncbi:MAG: hypothetical protein U0165_16640, partial [Polyangiaceae bacterium]